MDLVKCRSRFKGKFTYPISLLRKFIAVVVHQLIDSTRILFLFSIFETHRAGPDSQQLPTAHTCFNTLIVPDYGDNYDKLSDRLGRAIIECEGFGLQ